MSRRRKNAGEGYGFMFSGAFSEKKDAVAKEKTRPGSFIKGMPTRHGYRYVVMTPRKNPIKRRKRNPAFEQVGPNMFKVDNGRGTALLLKPTSWGGWEVQADNARARIAGRGRSLATHVFNSLDEVERKYKAFRGVSKVLAGEARENSMAWGGRAKNNPMDLVVMGANPGEPQEIVAKPGQTITIRVNPSPLATSTDDSHYMRQAAAELFGKGLEQLTARELSKVAMRAAQLKLERRGNGLSDLLGWGPGRPATKRERAAHRREWKTRVRSTANEMHDEYKRLRRSARQTFSGKKKLETLFHEVYGRDNPRDICGYRIGRYKCTRKPGHLGPHLPQGATLRPRSRHNWDPRDNPSAEGIREEFTGMPVDRIAIRREAHMPAGDYALLGKLLALYVKPRAGGQVQVIKATGGTQVVSDESARQLYFVGGDQDISAALSVFGAIDRGAGVFELGEARRIDYKQRKEHVPEPDIDEWRHEFGEETGERPTALFDMNHKRLLLEGGAYEIRPEGIVN